MNSRLIGKMRIGSAIAVWFVLVIAGLVGLEIYEGKAGAKTQAANVWPGQSKITLDPVKSTLVLFVHPQCPCSRATMEELSKIVARAGTRIKAIVVAVLPPGAPSDWQNSSLIKSAREIPGVTVVADENGTEIARFGAQTSGHAVLFSSSGQLLFSGGITASRGHVGDNAGSSAILAAVDHSSVFKRQTPVYGCSLLGPQTQACFNSNAPAVTAAENIRQ